MKITKSKRVFGRGLSLLLVAMGFALTTSCTDDLNVDTTIPPENNLTDDDIVAVETKTFQSYTYTDQAEVGELNVGCENLKGDASAEKLLNCNLKRSNQYAVYVTIIDSEGNPGEESQLDVLRSDAIYWAYSATDGTKSTSHASDSKKRTFSYVSVSFDPSLGEKLKFKVKPIGGMSAEAGADLYPTRYALGAGVEDESIVFEVAQNNRNISVNFKDSKNWVNEGTWVKHMLLVSVDPMEVDAPKLGDQGVVDFSTASDSEISSAKVIYFPKGVYNFTKISDKPSCIRQIYQDREDGQFSLKNGQVVYLEGGAFVEGYFRFVNKSDSHTIRGRGVLSGAQYNWQSPSYKNEITGDDEGDIIEGDEDAAKYQIMQLARGGNGCVYEGIHVVDSPQHGMVAGSNCKADNVKFLGWHANNDGFRFGNGTVIQNCFMRCCDDFFYNYGVNVFNCVLWPSYNGSIMTNGWSGTDVAGGSQMKNTDIINCEWGTSLSNNKGLLMSQNNANFNLKDARVYTLFENIRVDGGIPGICNLKLGSDYWRYNANDNNQNVDYSQIGYPAVVAGEKVYTATTPAQVGWTGNVKFKNIVIDKLKGSGDNRVVGAKGVLESDPNYVWEARNVRFENIMFGDVKLTEVNKDKYFQLNSQTTSNIVFDVE